VDVLAAILTLALLGIVILVLSAPLRAGRSQSSRSPIDRHPHDPDSVADRAALRAAREAKYREIRDAELDYRTGKLSQADYAAIDGTLRAEAVEILNRLAELGEDTPDS
jgi:hypothetical protein